VVFRIVSICTGGGYRYCRTDPPHPKRNSNNLYPLHRVLTENRLGRLLGSDEVVHHRDHNTVNDAPENLAVMSRADHGRHHHEKVTPVACLCPRCGVSFSVRPNQHRSRIKHNKRPLHCSRSCAARR
jgi:hypothetical protein